MSLKPWQPCTCNACPICYQQAKVLAEECRKLLQEAWRALGYK